MDSAQLKVTNEGASEDRGIDASSLHARIQVLTHQIAALSQEIERLRSLLLKDGDHGPEVPDLPDRAYGSAAAIPSPPDEPPVTLDEAQRRHIARVLALTRGRIYGEGGAAKVLGLKPSTLQSRMERLGMRRASPRSRHPGSLSPESAGADSRTSGGSRVRSENGNGGGNGNGNGAGSDLSEGRRGAELTGPSASSVPS